MAIFYTLLISYYQQQGFLYTAVRTACGVDSVAVRVLLDYSRPALPLDPSGLLLGTCPPSSSSAGNNMVVFQYGLLDCRFMRMVTANVTSYMNVLTYKPTQRGFYQTPFNQAIVCTYTKPAGWTPPVYNPALGDASGFGKLEFTMGIMNGWLVVLQYDFSAPRTSSLFFLGSPINIAAAVKQQFHMPLMVFMEECVAASTPELSPSSQTYSLITNHGCISIAGYWLGTLPSSMTPQRKPVHSTREPGGSLSPEQLKEGLRHTAVLGPLRILPEEPSAGSQEFYQRSPALSLEEPQQALAWLPVLAAPLLLMAVLGALSLGYYISVSTACGVDSVAVRVLLDYSRPALPLDPGGLLLGSCPPSSSSAGNNMVVFQYGLLDCRFMRMVTANVTSYMNVLTYKPTQRGFYQTPFNQAIVCTYTKPAGWTPPVYNPALGDASGFGKLEFTMGIMNDDFSAPRTSSLFFLGSPINIAAAVKQQFHMPLMVYMEECVAASTPELIPSSQTYSLITNHGCFVDGRAGNSRFLPRVQTSEIRLVVQAFKFTQLNTDVYIHCRLLAWDPAQLNDPTKKACSFNQRTRSWELLDNPGRSSVCSCCTSNCNLRKRRDTAEEGLRHTAVLGPLRILPEELSAGSQEFYQRSPALSLEEPQQALAWLPVLAAPLLLMAVLGALSLGYYMSAGVNAMLPVESPTKNNDLAHPGRDPALPCPTTFPQYNNFPLGSGELKFL
ncbi:UNVERIFIED_CONTAM: hypothetical protein FKN15_037038 [Acipenser sinensis]